MLFFTCFIVLLSYYFILLSYLLLCHLRYVLLTLVLQHPPDDVAKGTGKKLEFAGQIPRFTQPEIFFLSTLMTDKNSKEVSVCVCVCALNGCMSSEKLHVY